MDRRALAVSLGAVLGATSRWAVTESLPSTNGWPWATLAVNLAGSLLLGFLARQEWPDPRRDLILRFGLGVGFCGSLTTFSTLAVELARFLDSGRFGLAVGYASVSLGVGVGLVCLGARFRWQGGTPA